MTSWGQKHFNQLSTCKNPFYEQRQEKMKQKLGKTEKT